MKLVILGAVAAVGCSVHELGPTYPDSAERAAPEDERTHPARVARPVRVPYMLRGYFHAGAHRDVNPLGGHARSDNLHRPLSALASSASIAPSDDPTVLALVDRHRPFDDGYDGFLVIVANTTGRDIELVASDSRLPIVHEALDEAGAWRPIEYLPRSFCGNSRHVLTLPPGTYWELTAPHYDGDHATRLRIRASFVVAGEERVVYSNERAGRIHRGQLTERRGYRPQNLMDPYVE